MLTAILPNSITIYICWWKINGWDIPASNLRLNFKHNITFQPEVYNSWLGKFTAINWQKAQKPAATANRFVTLIRICSI